MRLQKILLAQRKGMVKLVLIRHSKSCANHVRHLAGTHDTAHPLVAASQRLRDPQLSAVGQRMAAAYGAPLQERLRSMGFDLGTAVIGSSQLRRAKQTAAALFPFAKDRLVTLPHFTEHGALPENTPAGMRYRAPDWAALLRHLKRLYPAATEFVIVGHGSYLRTQVWPAVTGQVPTDVHNLDGLFVEGDLKEDGRLQVRAFKEIPYTGIVNPMEAGDKCSLPGKIAALTKMAKHTKKARRTQKKRIRTRQRGGGVNMPLAYFQDGAQMKGTMAEATGVGLAGASAAWARAPLAQRGGFSCQPGRSSQPEGFRHQGGFSPAIMGQFAANGMRTIAPIASFMAYRNFTQKQSRRH